MSSKRSFRISCDKCSPISSSVIGLLSFRFHSMALRHSSVMFTKIRIVLITSPPSDGSVRLQRQSLPKSPVQSLRRSFAYLPTAPAALRPVAVPAGLRGLADLKVRASCPQCFDDAGEFGGRLLALAPADVCGPAPLADGERAGLPCQPPGPVISAALAERHFDQ